jgi:hypothetical protein
MLRKSNKKTYDFLKKDKKKLENDDKKSANFGSWAQTDDERYRWGIITSNDSEFLNSLFRIERTLPIATI